MTTRSTARIAAPVRNAVAPRKPRAKSSALRPALATPNRRLFAIGCALGVWGVLVVGRLVMLQVHQSDALRDYAERQRQRLIETSPRRGRIVDRNGSEMACSIELPSVFVSPKRVQEPERDAEPLARALGLSREVVLQKFKSPKSFVAVKRKVSQEEAEAVRRLNLPGVQFVMEMKRFYPQNALGAQMIGFVDSEERGQAGVERSFEKHLIGKPGRLLVESDAKGVPFNTVEQAPEVGQSLMLTVDARIQYQVERILQSAVKDGGAKGGVAVVMQPATGEILAMTSVSAGADPTKPSRDEKDLLERYRNRAVAEDYEPGSVFKLVTYSAALEEKLLSPERKIDCQGGSITIAGHTVRDGGRYGALTAQEALEVSSNVAAIKTGRQLGRERLLKYVERFGFGAAANVGLPGEAPGRVGGLKQWSDLSYASLPMGYEVVVTPVQVCAAMAAIANDGAYVQPHVAKKILSTTGDVLLETPPLKRRAVSVQTAQEMRDMLRGVVERGTGKAARLSGYTAGGKTGTAKKFDPKAGRYSETRYFATFVGFAPVKKPEIAVVVVMDEPPFGQHHGGQAAAPVFKRIAETILPLLGVAPDAMTGGDALFAATPIPEESDPFDGPLTNAVARTENVADLTATVSIAPKPAEASVVIPAPDGAPMPNLIGRGLRSATTECARIGVTLNASGFGVVTSQSPAPGAPVAPGAVCHVRLGR
jgi:cell division protein FtsI/penicillin-binding protein 2